VNAVKRPSEIDGEAVLTRPKGHDPSPRSAPRESELRASQNRQLSGHKILGRKIRLNHWAYTASENHRDTSGTFGEKHPSSADFSSDPRFLLLFSCAVNSARATAPRQDRRRVPRQRRPRLRRIHPPWEHPPLGGFV